MNSRYRIVIIITFLLVTLSLTISIINYAISLKVTEDQLKERSLPLTVDNIYTEIQKNIIEPNLVSSMMAHDTFLKNWLVHQEDDVDKISEYLEMIQRKYKMVTTFLVSEKSRNYYTPKGFIEKISKDNANNAWYFRFMQASYDHEINLDFNMHIDDAMIMFINHKIYDDQFHVLGATGIGLKISYIDEMLKHFRQKYFFNVYFLNQEGKVVLYERGVNPLRHIKDDSQLSRLQHLIISKESRVLEYTREGDEYLLNTKYIPELDLYLVVEAKFSAFVTEVKKTFYFNLFCSLFVTLLITLLILKIVKNYQKKLNYLAYYDDLTDLKNRRVFNEELQHFFLLSQRKEVALSLLFFDLDDFKKVNDELGHIVGDRVLQRVARILKKNIRQTDLLGRWGGEEFIVAFIDAELKHAKIISEKLRESIEKDEVLQQLTNKKVTASFGLTTLKDQDTMDSFFKRADNALYTAKDNGKNQIVCI